MLTANIVTIIAIVTVAALVALVAIVSPEARRRRRALPIRQVRRGQRFIAVCGSLLIALTVALLILRHEDKLWPTELSVGCLALLTAALLPRLYAR